MVAPPQSLHFSESFSTSGQEREFEEVSKVNQSQGSGSLSLKKDSIWLKFNLITLSQSKCFTCGYSVLRNKPEASSWLPQETINQAFKKLAKVLKYGCSFFEKKLLTNFSSLLELNTILAHSLQIRTLRNNLFCF